MLYADETPTTCSENNLHKAICLTCLIAQEGACVHIILMYSCMGIIDQTYIINDSPCVHSSNKRQHHKKKVCFYSCFG